MGARFARASRLPAALAAAAIALAACDSTRENSDPDPAPEEEASALEDGPFARALNYTCEGGSRIDMVMRDEPGPLLMRVDGGPAQELQQDPPRDGIISWEGDAPPPAISTWRAGETSVVLDMANNVTYTAGGAPRACEFVARSLPPPRVEGVDIYVKGSQAGTTLAVSVGESFAVSLSGVPTAGYVWSVEALPPFLEKTGDRGGSTTTAQFLPGFAGGNHWEVLVFEAKAAGTGELVLVQRRPWEDASQPDDQRFKLTVRVQ